MIGKGLLKGLGITFKHTFEKDKTIQYPEERPYLQDRFRGCLAFDYKNCIICGLCTKACPNNVLSYETAQVEGSKKKRLTSYTIDLQYCMFCNLCVEACPKSTLYFVHDFELATRSRDQIKRVYIVPEDAEFSQETPGPQIIPAGVTEVDQFSEAAAKRLKQVNAMKTALGKSPQKVLAKIIEEEADRDILAQLLAEDEKKLTKLAELMIEDRDKAGKVAGAYLIKEKRDRQKQGGDEK